MLKLIAADLMSCDMVTATMDLRIEVLLWDIEGFIIFPRRLKLTKNLASVSYGQIS